MIQRPFPLIMTLCALSLTSCATMIRGTSEELQFNSQPAGATATLSNGQSCMAPCSLTLPRNASLAVTFSKEHCDDQMLSVFPVLAGAGVVLGGIIDYGTGAVYSLQPNPVVAVLKCRPATPVGAPAPVPAPVPAASPPVQAVPVVLPTEAPRSGVMPVSEPETPQCTDPEARARCAVMPVGRGVYQAVCLDGSGLEIRLGRLTVFPPAEDRPHPWDAERCRF
jgi:hypothetical protein